MARIYGTTTSGANEEILKALMTLADQYFILGGFSFDGGKYGIRKADFLVMETGVANNPLYIIEVKDIREKTKGTPEGVWQTEAPDGSTQSIVNVSRWGEENPIQQARYTAHAFREWLRLRANTLFDDPQAVYRDNMTFPSH